MFTVLSLFVANSGLYNKIPKIIRVISPFKHKVRKWRIQVILYSINLNHQGLDVSMVITGIIIASHQRIKVTCMVI